MSNETKYDDSDEGRGSSKNAGFLSTFLDGFLGASEDEDDDREAYDRGYNDALRENKKEK
jgi:hypothetical protein